MASVRARGLIVLSILMIGWFYLWTVAPVEGIRGFVGENDGSYFNLLARGLLKGQLSLDTPADPALVLIANPYDPAQRMGHGLHDASYFRGRYYIYFGITPVLVLYLPFHLIAGTYLTDGAASTIFAFGGFLFSWMLLRAMIRTQFPATPLVLKLSVLWVLGLANMVPVLLRRASIWEVPISCAYMLFMLTLWLIWMALGSEGPRRRLMLYGASITMGLCVGARPTYLLASVVLFVPLAQRYAVWRGSFWREGTWWREVVAIALPIATIGFGLAVYNYLRFDSPFEFGDRYQMAGSNQLGMRHFNLDLLPWNFWVYFLSPPGLSPFFPFLTVIDPPMAVAGLVTVENPYGLLPAMPWVIFLVPAVILAAKHRGVLGLWVGGLLAGVVLITTLLCCFVGVANRYQVDFAPACMLLAAVGAVWWVSRFRSRARNLMTAVAVGLAVWSCGFNVLVSLQHNRLLAVNHPDLYARIARFCNHLPYWIERLTGVRTGAVEMRVVFPTDKRDKIEPLVVTGHQFLADYLFVHYLRADLIRFGFEHTSRGSWTGPATAIEPGVEQTLVVQMGSLFPPLQHPAYDDMPPGEIDQRVRTVKVLLNGRTVLQILADCYDASDWQPSIGSSGPYRPGFKDDFSGRILGWRRIPLPASAGARTETGKLHLLLRLPPFSRAKSEPLLSTGEPGKGDLIYIRYLDESHFQIGHDHWGHGGVTGPVIGYDPNVPVDLDIVCPPLLGENAPARLMVSLNGSPLIDLETPYYPSTPGQIAVGRNRIGASTAEAQFTGVIEILERVSDSPSAGPLGATP